MPPGGAQQRLPQPTGRRGQPVGGGDAGRLSVAVLSRRARRLGDVSHCRCLERDVPVCPKQHTHGTQHTHYAFEVQYCSCGSNSLLERSKSEFTARALLVKCLWVLVCCVEIVAAVSCLLGFCLVLVVVILVVCIVRMCACMRARRSFWLCMACA